MNIRFSVIVLLFSAYCMHVQAKDVASDIECNRLPALNFNATVNYVQDDQLESADLPPRYTKNQRNADFYFQDNGDDVIINITIDRQDPSTGAKEEIQILDDTGLFTTYLSGLTLVSQLNTGQPASEKDIQTLKKYLDKLDDTMDELDISFFQTNHAQNSLERIDDILDDRPIDAHALYTELHRMTYLSSDSSSLTNKGSAVIRGYIRSKQRNGQWSSWSIYRGPAYWNEGKIYSNRRWDPTSSSLSQYKISASSQFFVALLERARTDNSNHYLCSSALAQHSRIYVQPEAVGYERSLMGSARKWLDSFSSKDKTNAGAR